MKKNLFVLILVGIYGISQIPAGYYNSATGSGYVLKTQLFNIIKNNTNSSSTANYGDLWTLYANTAFKDNYYENNGTLMDVYSEKPTSTDSYEFNVPANQCGTYTTEGNCYNREHVMPQSVFGSAYPMYSDAHFVLPTDGYVNGRRSNYPYGKVNTPTWTSTNGSKLGPNLSTSGYSAGFSGTVFEPIDEFKGDIARCLLYVATRYEDRVTSWSWEMLNGTSTQVFTDTFKNILLTWHAMDPVSPYEVAKNNVVYYNFQNNRNPYIDHPEWVTTVWGSVAGIDDIQYQESLTVNIYPTLPKDNTVFVEAINQSEIKEILVFNELGQQISSVTNKNNQSKITLQIPEKKGIYFIKVLGKGFETNRQVIIK